jgi:hypothetical protein
LPRLRSEFESRFPLQDMEHYPVWLFVPCALVFTFAILYSLVNLPGLKYPTVVYYNEDDMDVVDAVGKAFFLAALCEDEEFKAKFEVYKSTGKLDEFVKILNTAIQTVWSSTEHEDEVEKEKYRSFAKLSLQAQGVDVTITNTMHLALKDSLV